MVDCTMKLIAFDPGKEGGIAYGDTSDIQSLKSMAMPIEGKSIDVRALAQIVKDFGPEFVIFEKVSAMPGQGVTSMFNFGKSVGLLEMIPAMCGASWDAVRPQSWKSVVLSGTSKDKDAAIAFCRKVYPSHSLLPTPRCKKPSDGIADAICIWEYGRRVYG